jgi:hypothetical protein
LGYAAGLAQRRWPAETGQVGAIKTTDPCSEAIGRSFEVPRFTLDTFHSVTDKEDRG